LINAFVVVVAQNLRSVAVQCRFATVDRAVSTRADDRSWEGRSVGVGDDSVDVDVVPVRQLRSAAVDCRPSVFHRAVGADFVYRVDSATNTGAQGVRGVDRAVSTDAAVTYPASTNTDPRLTGLRVPAATTASDAQVEPSTRLT